MTTRGDSAKYSGSCMCGAISYSFKEPPLTCGHCHCESCRRWQSAAFGSWTSFTKATFSLTGAPQIYESSPGSYRQFCGKCGSPLFMTSNEEPEVVYATLASLRPNSDLQPTRHVSFEERVAWDPTSDSLPKFAGKTTLLDYPAVPMVTRTYARDMAGYNRWQNEKLYSLCDEIGEEERRRDRGMYFKSIHNTLNHILTIDDAIFALLQTGSPKHIDFNHFPFETFSSLRKARSDFDEKLSRLPLEVDDAWFAHFLEFDSARLGRKRRITRAFMLMQLFNHQTHHRSQITAELFRMGIDYGNTDMPNNPECDY